MVDSEFEAFLEENLGLRICHEIYRHNSESLFFFLLFVHSFKFKVIFKCVEKNKNNFKNVMFYLKPIVMF